MSSSAVMLVYNAPADSLVVKLTNALAKNDLPEIQRLLHGLIALSCENHFAYGNLWQNLITYLIMNDENPFSLSCERRQSPEGTLRNLALHDFGILFRLFRLNYEALNIINNFTGSDDNNSTVCRLSRLMSKAESPEELYDLAADFYMNNGTGIFAMNKAFRFNDERIIPVNNENIGNVMLDDVIGYDEQKKELTANTEAFLLGRPANNVLLYGDGGTGKSTSVKALLNEYFSGGLRVIEIYKHQFKYISRIINTLRPRNYKFILFIDDLSFEENESEYKYLKAVIEGGIETRPDNILIYATSNRRHIVREVWKDRDDMEHNGDIHRSDTVEEKLSLASRFGIAINYSSPRREDYHNIVKALALKAGITLSEEELLYGADRWEIRHGGKSGRAARQYIDYLSGRS